MIWVIGGTSDANALVRQLKESGFQVLITTTTTYGTQLALKNKVTVVQQKMGMDSMLKFLKQYPISTVIDASHPFAGEVSENAIETCRQANTKYLRYERDQIPITNAQYYSSYDQVLNQLVKEEGNILLTIGSKNIARFKSVPTDRIIARVLPVEESIHQCYQIGLKAHQIIAMKGRISKETNKAIMQEYKIRHLVTKDSGEAGGLSEKAEAANELGVAMHILERPGMNYPNIFNNFADIINQLSHHE